MKKVILGILLIVITTLIGYSAEAQYFPDGSVINSGDYGNIHTGGTVKIIGDVRVSSLIIDNGKLTVDEGATFVSGNINESGEFILKIGSSVTSYGTITVDHGGLSVDEGATLNCSKLILNGTNFNSGTINVNCYGSGTIINNGELKFKHCSVLNTFNLDIHNSNIVSGQGNIHIVGYYNNESNGAWYPGAQQINNTPSWGHPLTNSSSITVWYPGVSDHISSSGTFGSASVSIVNNDPCTTLPINLTTFVGHYKGSGRVQFDWVVSMEHEVDRYEISQLLPDSSERIVAYTSSLGNTESNRSYSISVNYKDDDINGGLACMYCVLGIGLIVTVVLKRKAIVLVAGLFILGIGFTSCSKSNLTKESILKQKGIYRLTEVDKDGTIKNFQYIQVSTNI